MKIQFVVVFVGGILFANACFADIASTSYYTGGDGITVTNGTIAVANTVAKKGDIPTVPTAGTGISIADNKIVNTAISKVRSGGASSATLVDLWLE